MSSRTTTGEGVGRESGQTTTEYAVIVGAFAILIIAAIVLFRGGVGDLFERSGSETAAFRPPPALCDTHYSGGCVPEYPPDIDCDDLEARGMTQVTLTGPDDPHGLDPDGDGIGCN
jgi:Flp pilus assembly pilin Flp